MEQRAVVLGLLAPADQDRAVAVEPGVGGLDHPAPGTAAGVAVLVFAFVCARADVRREAERLDPFAYGRRVVALVQTEVLGVLVGGLGPLDRDRGDRLLDQLLVVAVRGRGGDPERDPLRIAENRFLRPLLALSVGLGPVCSPPSGALPIAPSSANHSQSIPLSSSYLSRPWRQNSSNTPATVHS